MPVTLPAPTTGVTPVTAPWPPRVTGAKSRYQITHTRIAITRLRRCDRSNAHASSRTTPTAPLHYDRTMASPRTPKAASSPRPTATSTRSRAQLSEYTPLRLTPGERAAVEALAAQGSAWHDGLSVERGTALRRLVREALRARGVTIVEP